MPFYFSNLILQFARLKNRLKFNDTIAQRILDKIKCHCSPEQIVNYYRVHGNMFVCHKTIYRWIKIGLLKRVFNFSDEKDGRINVYEIKISCEVVKVSMIDLKHLMSVLN